MMLAHNNLIEAALWQSWTDIEFLPSVECMSENFKKFAIIDNFYIVRSNS